MKSVEISRVADIPSEIIWDEMKHFDRVLRWVPGGSESTISVKVRVLEQLEILT